MSKRTKWLLAIGVIAALVIGWQIAAFAGQVGTASGFEDDDGNLADGAAAGIDWNSFDPTTWTGTAPTRQSEKVALGWQFKGLEDYQATTSDTAFNGGVKQDDACPGVGTGKADNKADLKRIYLSSKTGSNGHTYLNLAWVRIPQNTTSPSAHVAFEFNQNDGVPATENCPAGSDGLVKRSTGDMLIVYDFEGGQTDVPTIKLARWYQSATDKVNNVSFPGCDVASHSAPCWGVADTLTAGEAEAAVDTGFNNLPATALDTIAPTDETLGTNEFGEAGIDLTNAGVFTAGTCTTFGKTFGVSRTSGNSGTAQMKDLVGPGNFNLSNCGTVNIIKHTDPRGINQNFSYTSTLNADGSAAAPDQKCTTDTTPAGFTLNDNNNTTSDSTGNTESCVNVPTGSYTVTEGTDPSGFTFKDLSCTANGTGTSATPSSGSATRTASITLAGGGSVTCTYTNQQQLGAIKITKTGKDKSTAVADDPLAGAEFTIKKGGTAIAGSPFTTNANGVVCVDNLQFGTDYTVQETKAPTGYAIDDGAAKPVTVDNNAGCSDTTFVGETLSFTDTPLTDVLASATSQKAGATESSIQCVDKAPADFATGTDIGDSPDPNDAATGGTVDPAKVTANGLKPGTYTCKIVIDP